MLEDNAIRKSCPYRIEHTLSFIWLGFAKERFLCTHLRHGRLASQGRQSMAVMSGLAAASECSGLANLP